MSHDSTAMRGRFDTILAMDTGHPEHFPFGLERIGCPVEFYVASSDEGVVHYDVRHVAQFAPPGASAYLLESAYLTGGGMQRLLRFRYFHIDRSGKGDPHIEKA